LFSSSGMKISDTHHVGTMVSNPSNNDVLLGRGAACWNHPGNRDFREIVVKYLKAYENARLRVEKTLIVTEILDQVHAKGGRFLKKDLASKKWYIVENQQAIEKTGHAIRDKKAVLVKKEYHKEMARRSEEWSQQQQQKEGHNKRNRLDPPADGVTMSIASSRFIAAQQQSIFGGHETISIGNALHLGPFQSHGLSKAVKMNSTMHRHGSTRQQKVTASFRPSANPHTAARPSFFVSAARTTISPSRKEFIDGLANRRRFLYSEVTRSIKAASKAIQSLQETQEALKSALHGNPSCRSSSGLSSGRPLLQPGNHGQQPTLQHPHRQSEIIAQSSSNASLVGLASLSTLVDRFEKISKQELSGVPRPI
jgi:hypothetical protein